MATPCADMTLPPSVLNEAWKTTVSILQLLVHWKLSSYSALANYVPTFWTLSPQSVITQNCASSLVYSLSALLYLWRQLRMSSTCRMVVHAGGLNNGKERNCDLLFAMAAQNIHFTQEATMGLLREEEKA